MKLNLRKDELLEKLVDGTDLEVDELVKTMQPADILELIHENEEYIYAILERLPEEMIANILDGECDEDVYPIIQGFPEKRQKRILEEMSSDEITDLAEVLEDDEIKALFSKMDENERRDIKKLLAYKKDTAGGIMSRDFISIRGNKTAKDALEYLHKKIKGAKECYNLYVVDKLYRLKGVVSLKDIVCSNLDTKISKIAKRNVISVPYYMDQEEVAYTFEKYGFFTMPVVDEKDRILGVITVDDIVDVIRDEATEDINHLGEVSGKEILDGTLIEGVISRLPFLIMNLLGAILLGSVIGLFQDTIKKSIYLIMFIPIILIMGYRASSQSLTVVVRGISLNKLKENNIEKLFIKELLLGIISGLILGGLLSIFTYFLEGNKIFSVIIGVSMMINIVFANVVGFVVPIVLKELKVDPTLESSTFVTIITDIIGIFFLLGLSKLFIK